MTEEQLRLEAERNIKSIAKDEAEKTVAKNLKDLLANEFKSAETAKLIQKLANEAVDGMMLKEEDGREIALKALITDMSKQIESLEGKIKRQEDGTLVATPSFEKELSAQFKAKAEELKELKSNNRSRVNLDLKAASTFLLGTGTGAGIQNYSGTIGLTSWDSQIAKEPRRDVFMRDLVRVIPTDNLYIAWAEKTAGNVAPNGADTVAEGAKKPQVDWKYVEKTAKVEKIAVFIKVSKEALDDLRFLMAEINTELRAEVNEKLDEQMWDGDGVSPNLTGLLDMVPQYVSGAFQNSISSPNIYDVIVTAIAQVRKARFRPTAVVINPDDYYKLILIKDDSGNYIRPQFLPDGSFTIAGIRIIENEFVATGTFVVGDFSKATLAVREEINLDMGYENDDFTKNLVTILAEMRAVFFVKENYRPAFVKGSFASAIQMLDILTP